VTRPEDDGPRRHHYAFAHRVLPLIMRNPDVDLAHLAGDLERLGGSLRATWERVGLDHAESERLPPDGLAVERRDVGDAEGLLVTLPPARHVAEAIFVLVAPLDPPGARRYVTLEAGWDVVHRRPYTVLGEWSDRGHLNLGDGPPAEGDAFVAAVSGVLAHRSR
jgi:hypothetical protein